MKIKGRVFDNKLTLLRIDAIVQNNIPGIEKIMGIMTKTREVARCGGNESTASRNTFEKIKERIIKIV